MLPSPDASWAPWSVAAYAQREAGLDLVRLAIALAVMAACLVIFLLAVSSTGVLRRVR